MTAYTFIADFRGGTYISQHRADNLRKAFFLWKDGVLKNRQVQTLDGPEFARAFDADIDALPPIPIEGVERVWLFALRLGRYMLNVHVVGESPRFADVEWQSEA